MSTLLLIDLSSIAHPIWHTSGTDPNPDATSLKTVERVRALASGQPHVGICVEGGRSFRKDLDPTYKANRPEHDAALQHQIAVAIDTLKADGFPIWQCKGYEADDVVASATANIVRDGWDVVIVSSDKDLLQLVGANVVLKSLKDGSLIDAAAVETKFGVRPDQMRDFLSLWGDASDNVKGAKGIGDKKAAELLKKYGNLEDLYAHLDAHGSDFTPGLATSLQEFRGRMAGVRELITLRSDLAVPVEEALRPRVPLDIATFGGEGDSDAGGPMATDRGGREDGADVPVAGGGGGSRDGEPGGRTDDRGAEPVGAGSIAGRTLHDPSVAGVSAAATAGGVQVVVERTIGRADPRPFVGGHTQGVPARAFDIGPAPAEWERQLEPRSMDGAKSLAADLLASRLFSSYGHVGGVLATILSGRELGLPAMTSLRVFHVIDGKTAMSADLIRGLVIRSPQCEYFRIKARSATAATWVTKRRGDPEVELTYTIDEGRKAWQKDQKAWDASAWGKRPANMVTKTASSELCRLVYADVVANMYSVEELGGEERG